jgi:hypothetical protein
MFWYTHLEFIAHAIPTMPAYHQGRYIAARGSDNVDIRNRAFVMECVADVALTRAHDSSGTLKIFVAPEFFFRGRTGAYGLDGLQQVVRAIKLWASAKKFEHWLFFCGTVVATFENDRNEREIVNVAIVQHGGPSGATYTVMKEALAPDDFLTNGQLAQARRPQRGALTMETIVGVKNLQQFDALTNRGAGAEAQKKPYDGRGIFDDARIRFGVEVCADHLVSKLAKSPTSMFDWHPQVQVVTACGVQYIVADSVVAAVVPLRAVVIFRSSQRHHRRDDHRDRQAVDDSPRTAAHARLEIRLLRRGRAPLLPATGCAMELAAVVVIVAWSVQTMLARCSTPRGRRGWRSGRRLDT